MRALYSLTKLAQGLWCGEAGGVTRPLEVGRQQSGLRIAGDRGIRTPDLCDANAALSLLSYIPRLVRIISYFGVSYKTGGLNQ